MLLAKNKMVNLTQKLYREDMLMAIVFTAVAPHPPLLIPEIGRENLAEVTATTAAMQKMAANLAAARPETLVIITPHGNVFSDAIAVTTAADLQGSFANFDAPQIRFQLQNNVSLAEQIVREAGQNGIPAVGVDEELAQLYQGISLELDHGLLVPLYFLQQAGINCPVVPIAMGLLPFAELYAFGLVLQHVAQQNGIRIALLASADLSHRLLPSAPAGYHPQGAEFDATIKKCLAEVDVEGIISMPGELIEKAGECGLRPIIMLLGALEGQQVQADIHSYEGPFGVGYLVGELVPVAENKERYFKDKLFAARSRIVAERRAGESPLVRLARETLEEYVRTGLRPAIAAELAPEMTGRAGVFVSIKKNGQLRGCIGTIEPTQPDITGEIIANAISAGFNDPRFDPVEEDELNELVYSVDVLAAPEPITQMTELDPRKYGVIVRAGGRSGLLLPNLEGIDTAQEQVAIARQKAGIAPQETVKLERFEVKRFY